MAKKVHKFDNLEIAVRVAELMIFQVENGGHVKGFTDEEALNWSFRQCPICKVFHDNTNSAYCSYECTLKYLEMRDVQW